MLLKELKDEPPNLFPQVTVPFESASEDAWGTLNLSYSPNTNLDSDPKQADIEPMWNSSRAWARGEVALDGRQV